MTQYTNKIFLMRKVNELKRIEKMLAPFPTAIDPNNLSIEHVMLSEERKKLREDVKREAVSSGQRNPLEYDKELLHFANINEPPTNQSLSANDIHGTSNDIYKSNSLFAANTRQEGSGYTNGQVSDEERRRACEAIKPNGCGPAGWKGKVIADNPDGFDFTQACNNHDRNYGILGFGFERANDIFYKDMLSVAPIKKYRFTKTGKMIEYLAKPDAWAQFYYGVVSRIGKKYYDDGQRSAYICKYGKRPK